MSKKRHEYRSKFEAKISAQLEKDGVKFDYESVRYPFTLVLHRKYLVDFVLDNGIIIETKGKFTSDDRRKHLQLREEHPYLDVRFVFQRDNRLSKSSKTHYSTWCEKNGFMYAIGAVPKAWLKEKK